MERKCVILLHRLKHKKNSMLYTIRTIVNDSQQATLFVKTSSYKWPAGRQDVINIIHHPVWRDEGRDCEGVHVAEWTLHQRQDDQERKLHRAGSQTPENRYIPKISRMRGKLIIWGEKKKKKSFYL